MLKPISYSTKLLRNFLGPGSCDGFIALPCTRTKFYQPPPPLDTSEWPENRKTKIVNKQPMYGNTRPPRMQKMLKFLRGPEEVHTELVYKGYGVKALLGGRMQFQHFEAVRRMLWKRLDQERMFALWRVDPPWQPVSKRGVGKRMGGGKGSIHHYVTPVRAERIVIEIGGDLEYFEAQRLLVPVAEVLPFAARFYSHEELEAEKEYNKWVDENNTNPYTMEYVIRNNMGGCHNWLSPYDHKWFGKYK